MDWDEFSDLLAGLTDKTPLVQVAQIRTENDREALKEFSKEQLRMRSEWQRKRASKISKRESADFIKTMQTAFKDMFGAQDAEE